MTDYTATATREGRWWVVQCVEEPNAITQVARLDQVDEYLREALAFVTGTTDDDQIGTIRVIPQIPSIDPQLDDLRRLQQGAVAIESTARALHRRVAAALQDAGLTMRDVGAVLGVSHQRAHQILASSQARTLDDATVNAWTAALETLNATLESATLNHEDHR